MIHFTLFGATDARVSAAGFTAFTVFGGTDLHLPTLAERILHRRRTQGRKVSGLDRWLGKDRSIAFTIFGATDFNQPTLVEEYAALRNLVQSGVIDRVECRALIESLAGDDPLLDISRFTVFGASALVSPSKKQETKALDAAENTRTISPNTRRELDQAIGCPTSTAAEIVARAAFA